MTFIWKSFGSLRMTSGLRSAARVRTPFFTRARANTSPWRPLPKMAAIFRTALSVDSRASLAPPWRATLLVARLLPVTLRVFAFAEAPGICRLSVGEKIGRCPALS